jgi:hypothetical protein
MLGLSSVSSLLNTYNSFKTNTSGWGNMNGNAASRSASDRAEAVAEKTFQESLKAKMISGLYAAAKEIRS